MKKYSVLMLVMILVTTVFAGCSGKGSDAKYDIEKAFPDPAFVRMLEGDKTPVEFIHGIGGEQGYVEYPSKDPELIKKYVEAFKEFKLKETIKDKDGFKRVADGINDYTFYLEDGKLIQISLDLNIYATDSANTVQYVFEDNKTLRELNSVNDTYSDETLLTAVKNYCYSNNPDLKKIEEEGEYTVYWEVTSSDDSEVVILFRSYTGAQIRFYIDRFSGMTTKITEVVPGIADDETETNEVFRASEHL